MSEPKVRQYRPDIDGLRAVAVLAVVLFHACPTVLPGGFVGVDVFFVISGYLISGIIIRELEGGRFTYLNFYARRVRRILPALGLVLAAVWALGAVLLLSSELVELGRHIAAGAAFCSNILLWREAGYFDKAAALKPLLHLWSLGVEEQFYLTWPVLLATAYRRRWKVPVMIGALLAVSFADGLWLSTRLGVGAFYLLPSRYWQLMAGCALAYGEHARRGRDSAGGNWAAAAATALLAAALLLINGGVPYPGWRALLPTGATALFIYAGEGAWLNRRLLSLAPVVLIGRISYPLYLWHWPLLSFARIVEGGTPSPAVRVGIVALSFLLAWLTWRLIELPLQSGPAGKLSARERQSSFVFAGAGGVLAFVLVGVVTIRLGGFQWRYKRFEAAQISLSWRLSGMVKCHGMYGIPNDEYCLATSTTPRVIVWGDSHANHLNPGLMDDQSPGEFPFVQLGKGNCPALLDVERELNGIPYGCLPANERIRDLIGGRFRRARIAILASQTPWDFLPRGAMGDHWTLALKRPDGTRPTPREMFKLGLSRAIDFLEAQGKTVVYAFDVPELGFDPSTCSGMRPFFPSRNVRAVCGAARSAVDARQKEIREVLRELQRSHPRLRVFDPVPLLCDQTFCSAVRDGSLLYRDESHLTLVGSKLVARPLVQLLRTIDGGRRSSGLRSTPSRTAPPRR